MQEVIVTVDAGSGVGWRIDGKNREESLSGRVNLVACDWEGEQQGFHHCWKELLAVERCLQVEGEKLAGLFLLLRVDASTTVRYIKMSLSWDEKWTWKHPLSIIFYCIYTFYQYYGSYSSFVGDLIAPNLNYNRWRTQISTAHSNRILRF